MGKPPFFSEEEVAPEAPPPYTPSANVNNFAGPSSQLAPVTHQFPPRFNLYSEGAFSSSFTLGEHRHQPLYSVTLHTGFSGNPDVVLHAGLDKSSPPLATANSKTMSRHMTITLPPLLPSGAGAEERLTGRVSGRTYTFDIEVGDDAGRREPFEWRHSTGDAVRALGGQSNGWKLVRMGGGAGMGTSMGGPAASDGNEVVAVWAPYVMSFSKAMCFGFLGSGASGVLGERWAVMAVITALGLWDLDRKNGSASAAAS